MKTSRAPLLLAIVLLLLPVLYVGSYFANVDTQGELSNDWKTVDHYRLLPRQSAKLFWPLEQIDRKVRPRAWRSNHRLLIGE